jgi:hypothetical protein
MFRLLALIATILVATLNASLVLASSYTLDVNVYRVNYADSWGQIELDGSYTESLTPGQLALSRAFTIGIDFDLASLRKTSYGSYGTSWERNSWYDPWVIGANPLDLEIEVPSTWTWSSSYALVGIGNYGDGIKRVGLSNQLGYVNGSTVWGRSLWLTKSQPDDGGARDENAFFERWEDATPFSFQFLVGRAEYSDPCDPALGWGNGWCRYDGETLEFYGTATLRPAEVPLPGTLGLLGVGLIALGVARKRQG